MSNKTYIAIDLKSFYASVECVDRGLDPLNTNLVVADLSRTNKTICLAVSPALKTFGIPGRARLFEVEQKVKQLNIERKRKAKHIKGKSHFLDKIENDNEVLIDFIVASPRMEMYLEFSTEIYNVYLKYVSSDDIHVYSIDEVFIDATNYLNTYKMDGHELALKMIRDIMVKTGVTATAGVGTNLYLAKVAMDIVAKHMPADEDGVRIASLDERSYREILWDHKPLSDFWRIGKGYQNRLEKFNLHTMGDIARFSLNNDGLLYEEFGINAELLIDHAWGYEPCEMKDIKAYKSKNNSVSSGQVLMEPYTFEKAKIVTKEMVDNLVLDLVEKGLCTDNVGLYIAYDISNDLNNYEGEIKDDYYGRRNIKPANGSMQLKEFTSSVKIIMDAIISIYDQVVDKSLLIRRINISANRVIPISQAKEKIKVEQFDLFSDYQNYEENKEKENTELKKEENLQKALINIKNRFGKNSVLKGTNYEEGATGKDRNEQIGGHKK